MRPELKNGAPRIVSFFAKKARGSMARFVIENRITTPEGLKYFDLGGYRFIESDGDSLAFHRTDAAAA